MTQEPKSKRGAFMPSQDAVAQLARTVAGCAFKHARALTALLPSADPALRRTVEREVLAFGACLATMKLQERDIVLPRPFAEFLAEAVRDRHDSLAGTVERQLHRLLTAQQSVGDWPRELAESGGSQFRLDEEAYLEFCRTTGFDSKTMVGNGANLAALVFYLVTFGLLGSNPAMTRETRKLLLKEARLCRQSLEDCLAGFMSEAGPGNGGLIQFCSLSA